MLKNVTILDGIQGVSVYFYHIKKTFDKDFNHFLIVYIQFISSYEWLNDEWW